MQSEIELIEASLGRLRGRLPELPLDEVLILRLILLLAHEFGLMLDHQIRPNGLGEAEFRVLAALFSQPEGIAHPSDLCARASQSPANMSRISDSLVRQGLITRDACESDRRRMVLRITESGEKLVRTILPAMFAPLRGLYGAHSQEDKTLLITLLKRLAARFDDVLAPATADARA
ncbi:MAG: MarR family transcriptional regulator [Gammaproteobacteria bacterium]|nr:MarR family transcriptional regulator [Gammaproteobacteria bacterium]